MMPFAKLRHGQLPHATAGFLPRQRRATRIEAGHALLGIAATLLAAAATAGCGSGSPATLPQTDATEARLMDACKSATRELLTIDQHSFGSDAYLIRADIEHAASKAEAVDKSTGASVRRLPDTRETAATLGDLAHSDAELRAIVRALRRRDVAHDGSPRGMLLRFIRANSGCGTVSLRNPISG